MPFGYKKQVSFHPTNKRPRPPPAATEFNSPIAPNWALLQNKVAIVQGIANLCSLHNRDTLTSQKHKSHRKVAFVFALVEAGGIEPPSASPIRAALRTCLTHLI
jgi:hypothetical protein